ncbi:MAG TPA: TonB-dependent receptor, partial [Flavisolibacter sp.]|nr:TonB-dependent receptor [Flavisolibacter sp.]
MKRIAILPVICFSLICRAQENDTSSVLLPVEVRAVRAGSTAPFAKSNLSRNDISRQNLGQDLPFLLNQTPSVVVNSDAGNGVGYTGIRIRGSDASRINVTLNGIPYNDAESQGTFFVDLPDIASTLQSIQIQRGVGTSSNGSGAFGGSIHLSTNEVIRKAYAEANNSFGSFSTWKNTLKAGTGLLGGHFSTDIRLSRISSDGYIERAKTNLRSLAFSTAYLSDKTDIRLNVFTGNEKTYQAWNGIAESDLRTHRRINYAGTEKPGTPYANETDNYRQDHYQFFFTHRFSPLFSFNTAFFLTRGLGYYEQYKAGETYSDYNLPYVIKGSDTAFTSDLVRRLWLDNYYYGNIFSFQYTNQKTVFTLGGALTRYDGNHYGNVIWAEQGIAGNPTWYDLDARKKDITLYGKWQQNLNPSLQLYVDLQYRGVTYVINGFRDHPDLTVDNRYSFLNPKAGLSYRLRQSLFYLSYSRGAKEPNREDFESNLTDRPRAEKLNDWEAGWEFKSKSSLLSANLFYMKYKDQLVLTGKINDVGAYTRTNIANSYRLGIELQGGYEFSKWLRAAANVSFSRNRVKDFSEYIDDYDNGGQKLNRYKETEIAFSPDKTGAATITLLPVKRLAIDLLSKYVSRQYLDNTENDSRKLNSYFTQDIRFNYSLPFGKSHSATFLFQVINVFNTLYEPNGYTFSYYSGNQLSTENYYFPMAGTNWMAG